MSHFYTAQGECIEGLRAARKLSPLPLPSPTTVLSLIKSEGLIQYFKRQIFEATATTQRLPNWTDDEYYAAVTRYADEHSKSARDRGGDLHSLLQKFHLSCIGQAPPPEVPAHFMDQFDSYLRWYEKWIAKTISVEAVVIGDGYAGRIDHVAQLKDGRIAICDPKSQDLSKRKSFNHYETHALQLGAYAGAWQKTSGLKADVLVSIYISTSAPVTLEAYVWPAGVNYYNKLFMGLLEVWCLSNNYWPKQVEQLELVP